jgi:LacI family transcriptional regulator
VSKRFHQRPTIRDIAEHASVSVATVSRVLNHQDSVHPHIRNKVLESLRDLNYQPNRVARNLRTGRSHTIGVIIPDIQNPHHAAAVRGIQDTLGNAGYTPLLCNSDRDRRQELNHILALLARGVDGLVLTSAVESAAEAAYLVAERRPVVLMDRDLPDLPFDSVSVDCQTPTRAAVLHLVARGRRRIAHLAGPLETSTAREKLAGYREGLQSAGIAADPALIVFGDYTFAGGERAGAQLLSTHPYPDAVICANSLMTQGMLTAIRARGLAIPRDIAIVGTDDVLWTTLVTPPITVIAQPIYELGHQAAELLLTKLREEVTEPHRIRLRAELIVRESS